MKLGKSLVELATTIEKQAEAKRDYLAPSPQITMQEDGKTITLSGIENPLVVTEHAHGQIASHLKIPKVYYDRLQREEPELLADNVNVLLHRNTGDRRMVRSMDGKARAFMSDKYRPLDNLELLQATLPVLGGMKAEVKSCEVTESRMYMKVLFPGMEALVPGSKTPNDVMRYGICLSNSEIGSGSLKIEAFLWRLVCTNGMIAESIMRKYHVGRGNDIGLDSAVELWSDKTRRVSDAAFWMQVTDTIKASVSQDGFDKLIATMGESTQRVITGNPAAAVELLGNKLLLNEDQRGGVLRHLIEGGDLSQWGLANAVTRTAEDMSNYDQATELERAGSQVITLASGEWKKIAEAMSA